MVVKKTAQEKAKAGVKRAAAAKRPPRAPRAPRKASRISTRDVRLLEGTALALFVFLIVGTLGLTSLGGVIVHSNQSAAVEAAVMVDLTNQNRVQNALPGLTVSPVLVEAAQEKADDEAAKGYFAHTSPQGLDSWYWFKQAGYGFTYAGENLAVDFTDSAEVVSAWMNSPEHRANILDGHYTQIGIATASGMYEGHPTIFVVQEFGTPAIAQTEPTPIAASTQPTEPTQMAEASTVPATSSPVADASSSSPVSSPVASATIASASGSGDSNVTEPAVLGETAMHARPNTVAPRPVIRADAQASLSKAPAGVTPATSADSAGASGIQAGPMIADSQPVAMPMNSETALATPPVRYSSDLDYFLASPATTLRYAYYVIAFLVLLALLLTTGLEFRMHHLRATAAAGALVFVMFGLFLIVDASVFGHATISQSAAAIASTVTP